MAKKPSKADNAGTHTSVKVVADELEQLEAQGLWNVPKDFFVQIKKWSRTKALVPQHLKSDDKESVKKAQRSLHRLQSGLDELITIHYAVRNRLELLLQLEVSLKHALFVDGELPTSASGPRTQNAMTQALPSLTRVKIRWTEVEKLCSTAQEHLRRAMKVIELQMKLDDNVRWAQYRT